MIREVRTAGLLLSAALLLCGATACGGQEPKIQIKEETKKEAEYLSFFSPTSFAENDLGKYWSERFAKAYNQQVYVNYDGASYYAEEGMSYRELLEKRQESTSPDDIYIINAEDVLEFERKGYWMDLSGMDFIDNLSESALYQCTYDGKVFSVPLTFTGFGFYWNVSLLKEHGLSVPGNREEFLTVCETLKADGVLPYGANKGYALTVPAMCAGLAELYGSRDRETQIDALNSGAVSISSYMKEGFDFLALMIDRGYIDPQQAMNTDPRIGDLELFMKGQCAFVCAELGAVLPDVGTGSFVKEFTGVPLLEDGCISVYGASSRLCVNPESKHLDTALKFVEMVGSKEALDESASWQGQMSSAKDSKLTVPFDRQKLFGLLRKPGQIPNQDFELHFNTWESIRDAGRELCRGASVEDACAMLDELQRADLEAYAESKKKQADNQQ